MDTKKTIEQFAAAAHSLFVIGNWKWWHTAEGHDRVPSVHDIQEVCWTLLGICETELDTYPTKKFTTARTGRITCNLIQTDVPSFTLDISPRP